MRPDMPDLLVLRPRYAGGAAERKRAHRRALNDPRTFADGATYESSRRHYRSKSLSENFAPLLRFLQKNVGSRFDDVYAELRGCLRVDRACDLHVVGHLNDFLVRTTWWADDGSLYGHRSWGPERLDEPRRRGGRFYVDPQGIIRALKRAPRTPIPREPAPPPPLVVKGSEALLRVGTRFHHVVFERLDVPVERYGARRVRRVAGVDVVDDGPLDVVFQRPIALIRSEEAMRKYGAVTRYARGIGGVAGAADRRRFGV